MIQDLSGNQNELTDWLAAVDHALPALSSFTLGLRLDLEGFSAHHS
jgi:hypothetical protein